MQYKKGFFSLIYFLLIVVFLVKKWMKICQNGHPTLKNAMHVVRSNRREVINPKKMKHFSWETQKWTKCSRTISYVWDVCYIYKPSINFNNTKQNHLNKKYILQKGPSAKIQPWFCVDKPNWGPHGTKTIYLPLACYLLHWHLCPRHFSQY